MEMTFQQYIDNPMGKHNAVFSQRDLFKQLYTEKFDKVFLREAGKIDFTLYVDNKKDRYVAHIKVPSETVKDFYYDAVILFYTNDAAKRSSPSLQDYYVKFFSNDPAFVFTYLRVFLKNDLFLEDLKPKSSKLALKKDPKEKNPYEVPGYSKILYFAYLFMKTKNLFSKSMYTSYGMPYSESRLVQSVMHTDEKIALRQELGEKQRKQEANEKKKEAKAASAERNLVSPSGNIRMGKTSSNVRTTKTTNSVKHTPLSKITKSVKKK